MQLATNQIAYGYYKEAKLNRQNREAELRDKMFVTHFSSEERARDAGSADAYYGRPLSPKVKTTLLGGFRTAYSPIEIAAYTEGYKSETDCKDWR